MSTSQYKVLTKFRSLFDGTEYRHRASNQGDWVASFLIDDLYNLGQSPKLTTRVDARTRVLNAQNRTVGKQHRRGDGTFGVVVPLEVPESVLGYEVAFAAVANVEIGTETKILAKAMIKQLDRVGTDMINQAEEFRKHGNKPLCVGVIGINQSPVYRSLEGRVEWVTTGNSGHRHPIQEAEEAERRLVTRVNGYFDEIVVLRFSATNQNPFQFAWIDQSRVEREYGAALVRLSAAYENRF